MAPSVPSSGVQPSSAGASPGPMTRVRAGPGSSAPAPSTAELQVADVRQDEAVGAPAGEQDPAVGDGEAARRPAAARSGEGRRLAGRKRPFGSRRAWQARRIARTLAAEGRDALVRVDGGERPAGGVEGEPGALDLQLLVGAQVDDGGGVARAQDPDRGAGLLVDLDLDQRARSRAGRSRARPAASASARCPRRARSAASAPPIVAACAISKSFW